MNKKVLIGVDAGLTNTKVAAFNQTGTELALTSRPTPDMSTGADRSEQSQERLWTTVSNAISDVVDDSNVDQSSIVGVGVAGHGHGLYALDEKNRPLCGIKSTDNRALDLVTKWQENGTIAAAEKRLGWEPFGADPLSLLAWLSREEADVYNQIDKILFCKDVLKYKLTAEINTDPMEGSVFYGPGSTYDSEIFNILDIEASFDALPQIVPSTSSCGRVTEEAADETNLPSGIPVASGLHDVGACTLGAGVTDSREGAVILGTWGQSVVVTNSRSDGTGGLPRRYLDGWLRYKGIRSGAACVDWFVEECGTDWKQKAANEEKDPYLIYDQVVANVEPGSCGILFHPFLQGSTDKPNSRGGFYGLGLEHSKEHMLRAIYEGVAIMQCQGLHELVPDVKDYHLTGGGAKSEVWSQIFADILDSPVSISEGNEPGARGAAICAGVATGIYPNVSTAISNAVYTERTHYPSSSRNMQYDSLSDAFSQATEGLVQTWKTLKPIRQSQQRR
jgi:L-xylulokinase